MHHKLLLIRKNPTISFIQGSTDKNVKYRKCSIESPHEGLIAHIFYKFHNFDLLFCVQFDVFSHLNTDDTVRRIKEILSQYSISQRLFGEAVLGLSQVSSLYTV